LDIVAGLSTCSVGPAWSTGDATGPRRG